MSFLDSFFFGFGLIIFVLCLISIGAYDEMMFIWVLFGMFHLSIAMGVP